MCTFNINTIAILSRTGEIDSSQVLLFNTPVCCTYPPKKLNMPFWNVCKKIYYLSASNLDG